MADVKWIKITTNIFDDEKIKLIEAMPDRDAILIIWIKILTQAGRCNASGYLLLNQNIPYTDEMLSTIFNRPLNTVRMALEIFKSFGMIELIENAFCISNWEKHQNIEGMDLIREQTKQRVAKHREKQKQKLLGNSKKECVYCGKASDTIDHIIPKSKGGKDIPENIVDSCKSCNSSKSNKLLHEFLNDSKDNKSQNIRFDLILKNSKLMNYVEFDDFLNQFKKRYCNVTETQSNATEAEAEADLEKDKLARENFGNNIPKCIETFLKDYNSNHHEQIFSYVTDGIEEELIVEIIKDSAKKADKSPFGLCKKILERCLNQNILTLSQYIENAKSFNDSYYPKKQNDKISKVPMKSMDEYDITKI